MTFAFQLSAYVGGAAVGNKAAFIHDDNAIGDGENIFKAMLGHNYGGTQLTVYLTDGGDKVGSGNGVQLAGRLIKDQHRGLHSHNGGQIQQLLLSARKLGNILIEPRLNAEKAGHFSNAASDSGAIVAKALKAESQLVPHLIGNYLIFGALLDKADTRALLTLVNAVQRTSLEENFARAHSVGCKDGFKLAEQGGLAAAGWAAEGNELSGLNCEADILQGLAALFRVIKGQISDLKRCHLRSSFTLRIIGVRHRAK